jgi:protein TonB
VLRTSTAAATADWRARLLAHLNRFKRYPAAAQMRRQQGVAYVRLTLLPNGSVQGVRLQTSAGVESLDEEALALIQRALPLPVPPDDDGRHELVVPIQFTLR